MNTSHVTAPKKSFKVQMLAARETAIIQSVNRLLSEKGFDAMTVDEVAAEVGIAKASLYKHFTSKEELACAAMVTAMRRAQEVIQSTDSSLPPLDKIKAVTRWTMTLKLQGLMPSLPSQNSRLRATLMASKDYMDSLMEVSDALGGWIEEAQAQGQINKALPAVAVLYTLYARACDPVLEFLKMGEQHTDEQILDLVMSTCFDGLNAR
ncbi:TetR/AcrR family transcriptional regulator [Limnohabitans sp. 2KL-51]|jgi:AcrR family transcriptional regulator|uniref:TetR/AcrR family transcriptional regulator n=1 Tax=Limnohabitans sp. 2KL-51 TaxID=1977911 RepID=UPI000D34E4A0|nr:TetR/AcrR family transcriptional regulator [Limnohabitans sp. 2KL-51]PUE44862.1 TetR family transcriptional regulator [Limnohabitans sp. 2KL-51]